VTLVLLVSQPDHYASGALGLMASELMASELHLRGMRLLRPVIYHRLSQICVVVAL
jgi:hypothetical protein